MTITDRARAVTMDNGDIHCTAALPPGMKSAVIEDNNGAAIVVSPDLNAADRLTCGVAERLGIIQRRAGGKSCRLRLLRAGLYGVWYAAMVALEVSWRVAGLTWRAVRASGHPITASHQTGSEGVG